MLISPNLSYSTKTLYTKFKLDLSGIRMGDNSLKFVKYYRGQKTKFTISFHFAVRKFRLDERIPNLVSILKSDEI